MKTLNTYTKGMPAAEKYLTLLFLCIFLMFLGFNMGLNIEYISLTFKISSALADSSLIIVVCMLLRGRWKIIGIVIAIIVALLLSVNLLYYRNFEDIIQPSGYLHDAIGDPTVVRGAVSSLLYSDILFLILPVIPLCYFIANRKEIRESSTRKGWKLGAVTVLVVAWGVSYAGVVRRKSMENKHLPITKIITDRIFSKEVVTWRGIYEMHGFSGYLAKCIIAAHDIGMNLSSSDMDEIRKHLSASAGRMPHREVSDTGIKKNLIMIIVESLPFKVLETPDISELIPNLRSLTADSSSVVSKCWVLAGYGRSSDAQFIFNTGLLPLKHEAFADNYADYDYPSLAKALRYHSIEIIGERKGLWNHSLTTGSYGFDILTDNVAPDGEDQDSIIFEMAEQTLDTLTSPFFLFITTISMHDPYDSRKVSDNDIYATIHARDPRDREYYARLNQFDKSLGRFIAVLKGKGIFDDSVIVILGDHEIRASKISSELHDSFVPFIIINPPIEEAYTEITSQLDVFPTILDMMGCQYRYLDVNYSGLGRSIFSDTQYDEGYIPTDEDYRISEMIIKGRPTEK